MQCIKHSASEKDNSTDKTTTKGESKSIPGIYVCSSNKKEPCAVKGRVHHGEPTTGKPTDFPREW